jgi:hypothetical protein
VALTSAKWQARVLAECGRPLLDPATPEDRFTRELLDALQENLPDLWAMEAARPTAYLRYLYTKLAALDQLLGAFYRYVDVRLGRMGPSSSQAQVFAHLELLRKDAYGQIQAAEKQLAVSGANGAGGPSAGVLTRKAPYDPALDCPPDGTDGAGHLDPGSPLFGGHPLAWPWRRRWRW